MRAVNDFLEVVAKYGSPAEINQRAAEARQLGNLKKKVAEKAPQYLSDLEWLAQQRDQGAFIRIPAYRQKVLGPKAEETVFNDDFAVTLEISAAQYFPWLRAAAERALEHEMLMPGRFIRVRKMKEQEEDGDLPAFAAAMQIIGASYVETLDTKGTDGSNIHLGGPETITGYFGGVGQPNDHALMWLDEFLYYYTNYGVRQVLNINPGTVLLGYLLHRLGVDIEFKISVFMGNDNPYAGLWTLIGAKLFARTTRPWRLPPNSANHWGLRTLCALSITSPKPGRASCASPTIAVTSSLKLLPAWPTSPPNTRVATRTSTALATILPTSSITSATKPRLSRAATGTPCASTSWINSMPPTALPGRSPKMDYPSSLHKTFTIDL